ncbi:MAG TPA: NAD(P)-binding domain-containing protein [Kofleriaceae bacterium]|nr:NAD(P)-binding domain-containing protein [Kofleriaceae bacterium]
MSNKQKIVIIGDGNVGQALARGATRAGYDVKVVGEDANATRAAAEWAELALLAVPFGAIDAVAQTVGGLLDGKVLVDVTNALNADMSLALGYTTSGAEELQKKLPRARVAKAFNTVFAQHMDSGRLGEQRLSAFVASDDADAKRAVVELAKAIGFDPIDAGPLANARLIEPFAYLNIQLGYVLGLGTQIGFKLLHS